MIELTPSYGLFRFESGAGGADPYSFLPITGPTFGGTTTWN